VSIICPTGKFAFRGKSSFNISKCALQRCLKSSGEKPALINFLTIYSVVSKKSVPEVETLYMNQGYGKFKTDLAEAIITFLEPIQQQYHELMNDYGVLHNILEFGKAKANTTATVTLNEVKTKLGII